VIDLPENPASATVQRVSHSKQAYQFQCNTSRVSNEDANCEFDIKIQDGETPDTDQQVVPLDEGAKSAREDQLSMSQTSSKKITIMKKRRPSDHDRHVADASPKVQPDVVIKTKRRSSNSKVMSTEGRGTRQSSIAKPRDGRTRYNTQQL